MKKFDTYEDFVEHMTMLLSHNTYSSDITTDRIQYFVREISKKLDVGAHLWRNDAGWMLALNNSLLPSQNFFTKGFVFSDPQAWGILGLTDGQMHVLYSCVHCILLTGAKDFDEWKRKVEVDVNLAHDEFVLGANNLFYFCLKIIIVLFVLWFGLNFITHHKNYPEKKAEVETWLGFRTVTPTRTAMPTKTSTPTPIVPTAIVPTETPTAAPNKGESKQ